MSAADDLMREAHGLAEEIRRQRSAVAVPHRHEPRGVQAMEARLTALWTAIRVARASGIAPEDGPSLRRSRPKWE